MDLSVEYSCLACADRCLPETEYRTVAAVMTESKESLAAI